jgi:hypothetical protein
VTLSLNQGVSLVWERQGHPVASAITTLAAIVAKELDPSVTITQLAADPEASPAAPPARKPSFWGRLFGKKMPTAAERRP